MVPVAAWESHPLAAWQCVIDLQLQCCNAPYHSRGPMGSCMGHQASGHAAARWGLDSLLGLSCCLARCSYTELSPYI